LIEVVKYPLEPAGKRLERIDGLLANYPPKRRWPQQPSGSAGVDRHGPPDGPHRGGVPMTDEKALEVIAGVVARRLIIRAVVHAA
jgi:hypothetical protein